MFWVRSELRFWLTYCKKKKKTQTSNLKQRMLSSRSEIKMCLESKRSTWSLKNGQIFLYKQAQNSLEIRLLFDLTLESVIFVYFIKNKGDNMLETCLLDVVMFVTLLHNQNHLPLICVMLFHCDPVKYTDFFSNVHK